jgi:DNA-binding transcriptional LysR family regulator
MELSHLRSFLAVARKGSFSGAAEGLFRTQPAISLRVRSLESELGHQLLERRQRGVTLTPAGEIVRRRAESILGEVTTLEAELADLSTRKSGRVSLGANDTISLYFLPRVVKQFTQKFPGIELRLFTQISRRVVDLILSDQIDLGLVSLPLAHEGIEIRKLYEDRFVVVFPPGHALTRRRYLRVSDLKALPIIHLKPDTVTRNWIDSKLEPFGLEGQVRMEVSTIEVIKRLVEAGLGISILPEMAVREELGAGRLKAARLRGIDLIRSVGLAFRRGKYLSIALQAFLDELDACSRTS